MKIFFALLLSLATSHAVQLSWDRLNHPDVIGYILHFGPDAQAPSQHVAVANVLTTNINGLPIGSTIYFRCAARTATGLESGTSNQVAYLVPMPTPTPAPTPTPVPTPVPTPTPTPTPGTGIFKVGDRIILLNATNVRSSPGIANNLIGSNPTGTLGTLIQGPASGAGADAWWKVDYDSGFDGWSGEDNFGPLLVPTPTPTPVPTPTATPVPTPTPTPEPTPIPTPTPTPTPIPTPTPDPTPIPTPTPTPVPTPVPTPTPPVSITIDDVEGLRAALNSLQLQINANANKVPPHTHPIPAGVTGE